MKNLVVCSLLFVGTWAMPQGYQAPVPSNPLPVGGAAAAGPAVPPVSCGEGLVLDTYTGGCVAPVVTRNIYVYAAPEVATPAPAPVNVPPPKVDYNIVFVRSPENSAAQDPIIVPPPQQKTLVYVLSPKQAGGQRVIEVPAGPASNPEVYFVNYGPGENPPLPGGVDLQTALGAAAGAGQGIGGAAGAGQGIGGAAFIIGREGTAFGGAGAGGAGASTGFVGAGDLGTGGFGGQGGQQGFVVADQGAGGLGGAGQNANLGGLGNLGGVPLPGGQNF